MDMGKNTLMIIDAERYTELIESETRLQVLVDVMENRRFISIEDMLSIIGTPSALGLLSQIKMEERGKTEYAGQTV